MLKKLLSMALVAIMAFSMGITVFAAENSDIANNNEYEEYTQLVKDGTLGNDITFDYWNKLKIRSAQLEKEFENSMEFSNVYDSTRAAAYSMTAVLLQMVQVPSV